jgi:hypothetical protein
MPVILGLFAFFAETWIVAGAALFAPSPHTRIDLDEFHHLQLKHPIRLSSGGAEARPLCRPDRDHAFRDRFHPAARDRPSQSGGLSRFAPARSGVAARLKGGEGRGPLRPRCSRSLALRLPPFRDPSAAPGTYDEVAKGRMRFEEVAAILNAVAAEADIVGLAITEYIPWSAIKLSRSLRSLPLLGGG